MKFTLVFLPACFPFRFAAISAPFAPSGISSQLVPEVRVIYTPTKLLNYFHLAALRYYIFYKFVIYFTLRYGFIYYRTTYTRFSSF